MLKAIDTKYAGHLFRSRLEARWAVFFDCLGIHWEYEPEGYVLPDGVHYLPDFRITTPSGARRWIEIKPAHIKNDPKFAAFAKALEPGDGEGMPSDATHAALASGSPLEWMDKGKTFCPRCGEPLDEPLEEYLNCYSCDWQTPCGGGNDLETNGIKGIEPLFQPPRLLRWLASNTALTEHGADVIQNP